jgi:hypothetical protein
MKLTKIHLFISLSIIILSCQNQDKEQFYIKFIKLKNNFYTTGFTVKIDTLQDPFMYFENFSTLKKKGLSDTLYNFYVVQNPIDSLNRLLSNPKLKIKSLEVSIKQVDSLITESEKLILNKNIDTSELDSLLKFKNIITSKIKLIKKSTIGVEKKIHDLEEVSKNNKLYQQAKNYVESKSTSGAGSSSD